MLPTGNSNSDIRDKGFTLIEIMFAVVMLSFGLVLVLRSFAISLEAIKRSENVKIASSLLEEKIEEIKEKTRKESGISKGNLFGKLNQDYEWNLSVNQSDVREALNEVKLVVSWQEGKNQRSISATTYLENKD